MEKILQFLYNIIVGFIGAIAFIVELPVKIISIILFLVMFILLVPFAPWLNNCTCPNWWDIWVNYNKKPLHFVLVKWVIYKYS
jgi:hypothetical protein